MDFLAVDQICLSGGDLKENRETIKGTFFFVFFLFSSFFSFVTS